MAPALAFPHCFYCPITMDRGTTKCVVAWPEDSGSKMHLLKGLGVGEHGVCVRACMHICARTHVQCVCVGVHMCL